MARIVWRIGKECYTYRDPANATSNQNARPWMRPDCAIWNTKGISTLQRNEKDIKKNLIGMIYLLTLATFVRSVGIFTEYSLFLVITFVSVAQISTVLINAWVMPHIWEYRFLRKLQVSITLYCRDQKLHTWYRGWWLKRRAAQDTDEKYPPNIKTLTYPLIFSLALLQDLCGSINVKVVNCIICLFSFNDQHSPETLYR